MKKYVLTIVFACLVAANVSAQAIYKEVVAMKANVEKLMNDYLIDKAADTPDFTEYMLGEQATAMIDFVNLYVKRLSQERKKKDKDIVLALFKNASCAHPLFDDPDKEVTYGYVDNEQYITQFALDTDWVKALKEILK